MCDRRSRDSGSMVWYSSSMPMVKLGRLDITLRRSFRDLRGEEPRPVQLRCDRIGSQRTINRHIRNGVDDPLEILRTNGFQARIRSGVHEVDRIWHSVMYGKFHSI